MVVRAELEKLNLHPVNIALGEVVIEEKELTKEQLSKISDALKDVGFELIDDRRSKLIEQINLCYKDSALQGRTAPNKNLPNFTSL